MIYVKDLEKTILGKEGPFNKCLVNKKCSNDVFFSDLSKILSQYEIKEHKVGFVYHDKKKPTARLYIVKPEANVKIRMHLVKTTSTKILEELANTYAAPGTTINILHKPPSKTYLNTLASYGIVRFSRILCPIIKIKDFEYSMLIKIARVDHKRRLKKQWDSLWSSY
ncbi:MAG: hypothetical protein JSW73_04725 [Candidatus Woesearchaeota archaeon]|nr:MAG: hypothetical protein JSW73_04725 [Candidatus Woesearchaeota archaeon]